MTGVGAAVLVLSGVAAGAVNTVVGSGSLLTYPILLGLGYSPLVANVTNTVGVAPGAVSGALGLRGDLHGQALRLRRLLPCALLGGFAGAVVLLAAPGGFARVVPYLILAAAALMGCQPAIAARQGPADAARTRWRAAAMAGLAAATGFYGGYFGAAQGVILLALLQLLESGGLRPLNACKNVLTAVVNVAAAGVFLAASPVAWRAALALAAGSAAGGQLGARLGRRLSDRLLRAGVVVVGLTAGTVLLIRG